MKRTRNKCANPLFEKWLEEWKQEAAQRNSTLQHSFAKALDSLRKYPLLLDTGKDCEILMHFGKKLCLMLDKKLKQHIELNNGAQPLQSCNSSDDEVEKKKQNINEIDNTEPKITKKQTHRSEKPYIPKFGSASFAILITMYKSTLDPDYPGFISKKDIINGAQEISDCAMKNSALHHYSGWNSMKTLINKNLIIKINQSNYSLTDHGKALAVKLKDQLNSSESKDIPVEKLFKNSGSTSEKNISQNENITSPSNSKITSPKTSKKSFESSNDLNESYVHVDLTEDNADLSQNACINDKKINEVVILSDEEDELSIIGIKTKDSDLINPKSLYDPDTSFNQFCEANVEPEILIRKKDQHIIFKELCNLSNSSTDSIKENYKINEHKVTDVIQQKKCDINKKKVEETRTEADKCIHTVNTISKKKQMISSEDACTEYFYLLPNNFDVILLVDTHETSGGKTKPKNDETIAELSKSEILFEIRSLKIGDFTWIARCRFTNRELILPYIVERKRIDDFGSSIKDGRYHEQKFRLRQSGIKNIIYLIENYGTNYYGSIPITTLLQAATNSLVQDDFTIKYTKDHKHSMRYLATLTKQITKIYESKELVSSKKINLKSDSMETCKGSLEMIEFNDFNKSAIKTKNFKVQEMMIRQLLQIKGLSVEKAMVIAEKYPTPKILVQAFKNGNDKLLANLEIGPKKQKLGPVLSRTIFQLYTLPSFN